jgi:hypothetical protein
MNRIRVLWKRQEIVQWVEEQQVTEETSGPGTDSHRGSKSLRRALLMSDLLVGGFSLLLVIVVLAALFAPLYLARLSRIISLQDTSCKMIPYLTTLLWMILRFCLTEDQEETSGEDKPGGSPQAHCDGGAGPEFI